MKVNNIIIIDTATFNLAKNTFGARAENIDLGAGVSTEEIMLCREPEGKGFDLERVWIANEETAFKNPEVINRYITNKNPCKITEINIHTRVIESCKNDEYDDVIQSLLANNKEVLRIEILSYGGARVLPFIKNKVITALPRGIHERYMRHSRWQECTAEHENIYDGTSMTAKEHAVCKDFDLREFFKLLIGLHIDLLDYYVICDSETKKVPSEYTELVYKKYEEMSYYEKMLKNKKDKQDTDADAEMSYYEKMLVIADQILEQIFKWQGCENNISASDFCKKYEELVKISCDLMRRSKTNNNE